MANLSTAQRVNSPSSPLLIKTRYHNALNVYDSAIIPKNMSVILLSSVFDGIGDLEHTLNTSRHLVKLKQKENFKLYVWLERSSDVPETAWRAKLAALSRLNIDGVYCIGTNISSSYREQAEAARLQLISSKERVCVINVSSHTFLSFSPKGIICEYGMDSWREGSLITGLQRDTAGIWIKDDPVFNTENPEVSDRAKILLFNELLSKREMESWEVGFASLRFDSHRLKWMDLRLGQVDARKNCTLVLSKFQDPSKESEEVLKLAKKHGFDSCIISGQKQTFISCRNTSHPRILRIVHDFVDEDDLPAIYNLAKEGSIGGAGDTACNRALLGKFPPYIERRLYASCRMRWARAAEYAESMGFSKLRKWFLANLYDEPLFIDKELMDEWTIFRQRAMKELDIGIWVDRYVRRCVFLSSKMEDNLQKLESDFIQEKITFSEYETGVKRLICPKEVVGSNNIRKGRIGIFLFTTLILLFYILYKKCEYQRAIF